MINQKLFADLLTKSQDYGLMREKVVGEARVVLKMSKQAIFLMHRDDVEKAEEVLANAEKKLIDLGEAKSVGAYYEAAEEFVEAKMFLEFLKNNNIDFKSEINFGFETMISGICDLTGEMVRMAVILVTKGRSEKIADYKQAVDDIVGELIKFDLTGKMRMKFDEAKRNLKRLEEILYDVKIRTRI